MSMLQELSLKIFKDMHQRKDENNLTSLAKIMIDYHKITDNFEGRDEPNLVSTRDNIISELHEMVDQLDGEQIINFAYSLRQ